MLLREDLRDHNGVGVDAIDDPPGPASVLNPELVTMLPDAGHWSGMGHAEELARLEPSQKNPASTLAAEETGGVLISPPNQTKGLSFGDT